MILDENRLPADIMPYLLFFEKVAKFAIFCRLLQIIGGALRVNLCHAEYLSNDMIFQTMYHFEMN